MLFTTIDVHRLTFVVCFCHFSTGLTITVNNGEISVSNDNMTRISVYDFAFVNSNTDLNRAMRCQSELSVSEVTRHTYVCHVGGGDSPVICGYLDQVHISFSGSGTRRGWSERRVADEGGRRVHYLWRRSETSEEGYFNCYFRLHTNELVGLYVLYPSEYLS